MEEQPSGSLIDRLASSDSLALTRSSSTAGQHTRQHEQLVAKLKEEAQAGGPNAELLSLAAAAVQQLQVEVSEASTTDHSLMKPSAWMTRENKYKKDLQQLRREIEQHEEDAARMKAELQAASSGTLVEKLRADIKVLEQQVSEHKAARSELSSTVRELTARTHTLLSLSPALTPVWKEICAGKRVVHTPVSIPLLSRRSLDAALDNNHSETGAAEAAPAAAPLGGSDGGVLPAAGGSTDLLGLGSIDMTTTPTTVGSSTISVEHLSVSAAKAKLAQAQLLSAGSHSMPAHLHSTHSTHWLPSPAHPPHHPAAPSQLRGLLEGRLSGGAGAGAGARTPTHGSRAGSARHSAVNTPIVGSGSSANGGALFAEDALPTTITPAPADEGDDSQLIDLDDLLSGPAPGVVTCAGGAASSSALPAPSSSTPAPHALTSTAVGSDTALGLVDAAAQVLVAVPTSEASTHTDPTEAAHVGTQSDEAGAAPLLTDAHTQSEAQPLAEAGTQSKGQPPHRVSDMGVQCAAPELRDGSAQVTADMQSAAVQAELLPVPASPVLCDAATQPDEDGLVSSVASPVDVSDAEVQVVLLGGPVKEVSVQVAEQPAPKISTSTSVTDLLAEVAAAEREAAASAAAAQAAQAAGSSSEAVAAAQAEAAKWEAAAKAAQAELAAARAEEGRLAGEVAELRQQLDALGKQVEDVETEGVEALLAAEDDLNQVKDELGQARAELAQQAAGAQAALEQVRAAAAASAKQLAVAQAELARVKAQLVEAHKAEEQMRLQLQAYEHTMAGLRVAVEEADVEKHLREAQNLEMAQQLATMNEFVHWKAQNPKNVTVDYSGWLKRRPSLRMSSSINLSHEDVQRTDVMQK